MLLVFKYSCCCLFFGSNATSKNLVIHYPPLFSSPLSASKRLMTKQSFVFSYILSPSFYPASPTTTYLPILSISILNWYTLFVLLEGQRRKKFYVVTFPVWKGYSRDSLLFQCQRYLGLKTNSLTKNHKQWYRNSINKSESYSLEMIGNQIQFLALKNLRSPSKVSWEHCWKWPQFSEG